MLVRVNELDVTIDHTVTLDDDHSVSDLKASSRNRKTRKKKIRYENGEEVEIELNKRHAFNYILKRRRQRKRKEKKKQTSSLVHHPTHA